METSIFEKYGQAYVLGVADPQDSIEKIEILLDSLKNNKEFIRVLGSPKISKEDKKKMLGSVLKPISDNRLENFVYVLVDNSRERYLIQIFESALSIIYAKVGVKRGYLFSSMKLSDEEVKEIEIKLSLRLNARVRLKQKIDPSLLGGIKVALDDKVFDATLKKRLEELKLSLLGGHTDENQN